MHQGRTVTLWEWLDGTTGAGEPAEAARALRSCHEALMSTSEPLDPWEGLREARESFTPRAPSAVREELERLGAAAHDCVIEIRDGLRPVHGDAYPGNIMWTVQGPILIDWEDAHLAPVEWDLASWCITRVRSVATSGGPMPRSVRTAMIGTTTGSSVA